ncbi:MAG TPA: 5-(carboxyamino)imidazole ribonucleotide mutase [Thermoanaerobaculia bacterium]|nr:5-(carboxyamino)imidazole ribonucleotide mutase [Thermoanaerobaculia bacterium]
MADAWVCILMGSDSDAGVMSRAADALDELGVAYELTVASAHRTPERVQDIIRDAEKNGARVFIAGAGAAAHLPGVVASLTSYPVIGVPLEGSALGGFDALLSIAQMPGGIPVATVAVGGAGAKNAGILAAQILAIGDPGLADRLQASRSKMREEVAAKARQVERRTTGR